MKTTLFYILLFLSLTTLAQVTYVPDNNFEQALIDLNLDDVLDDEVSTSNIENLTSLDISDKNISDLTGIENFTALIQLRVNKNNLSSIGLSNNYNLQVLFCNENRIINLDLSNNSKLNIVACNDNLIETLNVSNNPDINTLWCYNNKLTSLDVSSITDLKTLSTGVNRIKILDVTKNTKLENLYCADNLLTILNVANGNNSILENFNATNNSILTCIQIDDVNSIGTTWTKDTSASYNESCITYIPDNNFEQALIDLGFDDVLDDYVTTTNINTVTTLDLNTKNISDLTGIEGFTALETLNISRNTSISSLTFDKNLNLKDLNASQLFNLSSIDITKNTQLEKISLQSSSGLTELNLLNNTNLKELSISNCKEVANLDLSNNLLLETISLSLNNFSALSTTGMSNLKYLVVGSKDITTLNLEDNLKLETLRIAGTSVASIDVSKMPNLEELNVSSTKITALNISANPKLKKLNFQYTLVPEIDLSNNNNIEEFTFNGLVTNFDTTEFASLKILKSNEQETSLVTLDLSKSINLESILIDSADALEKLNLQNGNNTNFDITATSYKFLIGSARNIQCIQVDSVTYSNQNWFGDFRTNNASYIFPPYSGLPYSENCFEATYVPDDNFEQALIDLGYDDELDNHVNTTNINTLTSLNIANKNISDLTGIEDFIALSFLGVNNNSLTKVDLSKNLNLESLSIYTNQLEDLDLSKNLKLTRVNCDSNNIKILDLSKNVALVDVSCARNNLLELNLKNGNNANITYIFATNNPDLNCVQVDNVSDFDKYANRIDATASYSENCGFTTYVPDNNFEQALIDLGYDDVLDDYVATRNINTVTDLFISGSNISDLTGIENFVALTSLDCASNNLTTLDVTKNTELLFLSFSNNKIATVDLKENTDLELLYAFQNNLTVLDVSMNTNLTYISCSNNKITSLNVENNLALTELYCDFNQIEALDVSKNTKLFGLLANDNSLTTLNLKNGNNANFGRNFNIGNNPNLNCIEVDDVSFSTTNWSSFIPSTASFSLDCGATASIVDSVFNNSIVVYPNPVKNTLSINIKSNQELENVQVFNLLGKKVIEQQNKNIDFNRMPSGMYILKIISKEGKIATKRVVKKN